jgi:spore coat polysaccharide biosynthesis protein SpsF (cytidylyltransferase family)
MTHQTHNYTQTENIKQLRVACSECSFTVFCGCSDNILDRITGDLRMSSSRQHMKAYCLLVVRLWNKCLQND